MTTGSSPATTAARLYAADLSFCGEHILAAEASVALLDGIDLARAQALTDRNVARLWLASRRLLRLLIAQVLGVDAARQPFLISAGGRPLIATGSPVFSVAHSWPLCLIAVGSSGLIGADIELARPRVIDGRRRGLLIDAARGLTASGAGDIAYEPIGAADPDLELAQAWTRLEALAKSDGGGIGRVLTMLGVRDAARSPAAGALPETPFVRGRIATAAIGAVVHDVAVPWPRTAAAIALPPGEQCPPLTIVRDPAAL